MVDLIGLAVPFAYLGILVGSLATFSSLYRKRKAAKSTSLEPWFGPHVQRNIYFSLLHLEPQPGQEKATPVPDSILKAALLQRATEDIRRILAIRGAKQPLSQLLQGGSVGDELWQRFLRAEKGMEAELRDVVEEANALATNWGQTIFQSANEMVNNAAIRDKVAELQAKGKADREWWDKERASIQSKFMQELDEEKPAETPKGAASGSVNSDEDAVFVEGGGPVSGSTPGSKRGTGKKKKSKK
ncbi:hypothetical protein OEA41_000760 [Lepraria neglecta]|uniref:Translocation protein n=1 Tax=Lepraria neglecta TaxID=209136 RepID=A0AAD9ZH71_9LECA|nr:hypothetical protein OEA41_000760 [Lepraria neglecta]